MLKTYLTVEWQLWAGNTKKSFDVSFKVSKYFNVMSRGVIGGWGKKERGYNI